MSRRIRPSARKKTLHNVMCSALSETDKKCIEEVFEKFELQKAEIEKLTVNMNAFGLGMKQEKQRADEWHREAELTAEKLDGAINAQETLQKALAEKNAEIKRLYSTINEIGTGIANIENLLPDMRKEIYVEAIKKFADGLITQKTTAISCDLFEEVVRKSDIDNLVKKWWLMQKLQQPQKRSDNNAR